MNTIDELLKSFGFDEPIAEDEAEAATPSENTIVSTNDAKWYIKGENETAEDFVKRLPPSKLLLPGHVDYITVNSNRNIDGLDRFLERGQKLLKRYKEKCINEKIGNPHTLLGDMLLQKLKLMAIEENFLESKFRLIPPTNKVDNVWLKIVRSTMAGELGINAKINRKTSNYEIHVYMKDLRDKVDEKRVYRCLYNLRFAHYQVQYKGSFLSKLGIGKENIYNITPRYYPRMDLYLMREDRKRNFLYEVKEKNESADSFVSRLLPSKVLHSNNGFITTFPDKDDELYCTARIVGLTLLETYKHLITNTNGSKRHSMTRELQKKLTQLSVECNFVKGRWIAYASDNVDLLWLRTVQATVDDALGINARIQKCNDNNYEICVMTTDFNDKDDVMRVLGEMKKLGFNAPFLYKTQLYRRLNIKQNNHFDLNPYLHEESTEGHETSDGKAVAQ